MGQGRTKNVVAVRRRPALAPVTRQALKVAGTGAIAGAAAGLAVGGSVGIAAFGTAVGAPLIAVGAIVGAGVAGLWSLFFGGDRKRLQLFQRELEEMQSENRTLRQQLYGMSQEALDTSSEVERLSAEVASLQVKVKEGEETIKRLLGAAAESVGRPVQYWAGMTQTGAIMIFDPECQMSCGQHVLLFLPSISDYRVFGKGSMRSRLTKLAGDELAHHAAAYEEWLRTPTNRDIQKKAIAQLVKRASTSPKKP